MWTYGVVVDPPALSQYLHFLERVEDLAVQGLIAQLRVERFAVHKSGLPPATPTLLHDFLKTAKPLRSTSRMPIVEWTSWLSYRLCSRVRLNGRETMDK